MPNHIQNRLKVFGTPDQIERFFESIKGDPFDDGSVRTIDFRRIIPQPEDIFVDNITMDQEREFQLSGRPYWSKWNPDNWGTKWNAYMCGTKKDTRDTIFFQTAWSAPIPVINAVARIYPGLRMEWDWADEDTGHNTGRVKIENGKAWIYCPLNGSIEAYELCFELGYRDNRHEYELVDVKGDGVMEYRYKEENG